MSLISKKAIKVEKLDNCNDENCPFNHSCKKYNPKTKKPYNYDRVGLECKDWEEKDQ